MSHASMKDVAALAGVSIGTVSNVLNRPDLVRSVTRRKVETAIAELGFVPNGSERKSFLVELSHAERLSGVRPRQRLCRAGIRPGR